ncbi:magnesium transporter CorA family protein [bacterium]|nr:magnesium transporter CorA family protein [bacterium]
MIEIFRKLKGELKRVEKFEKSSWVNLSSPSQKEIEKLTQELNIPLDFITDPLDSDERARIEIDERYNILIVLRIPKVNSDNTDVPYITLPVGIIITDDLILTVCSEKNIVFESFIMDTKLKDFSYEDRNILILHIFQKTAILYLKYLKEINKATAEVEEKLHKDMKNDELIKLLNLEKSLVYFTTSLKSNELMMERLQKIGILQSHLDDNELLEDVLIDNKQAIETANIYSNILSGMMDAFASIISNNLNIVMKFLTSVTIILMLPTLVASIYGMNISLPFQDSPHAFLITVGISVVLSAIGVIIFIKRKWF